MPSSSTRSRAPIGGFLPLELGARPPSKAPADSTFVNSGRNALLLIATTYNATRVHLPMLGCDALAAPLHREGIEVSWYPIGRDLLPAQLPTPSADALVVLCDIYGVVGGPIRRLAASHPGSVLDLTHASLTPANTDRPWFASYRKMLGLADGAIAVTPGGDPAPLERDHSSHRYLGRLRRHDVGPRAARAEHLIAEAELDDAELMAMSPLTERLLESVDVATAAAARRRHFERLDRALGARGIQRFGGAVPEGPFAWPLKAASPGLHKRLHSKGLFVPKLWPDVAQRAGAQRDETWVAEHCVPLPIDHHLSSADVDEVARRVIDVLGADS